jgi:hypothetical protein
MGLQSELNRLASSFTHAVFQAIREVSLEELLAETGGLRGMEYGPRAKHTARSGRTARRGRSVRRAEAVMAATTGMGSPAGMAGAARARRAKKAASAMAGGRPGRPMRRGSGRLKRRSGDDIKKALVEIVSLVERHPKGMRAEEIRSELGMQAKEMPRILGEGLASRKLKKRGHKRATTYYAG